MEAVDIVVWLVGKQFSLAFTFLLGATSEKADIFEKGAMICDVIFSRNAFAHSICCRVKGTLPSS